MATNKKHPNKRKDRYVQFRMSNPAFDEMEAAADKQEFTLSEFIRQAVRKEVARINRQ